MLQKECSKCKEIKKMNKFSKDNSKPLGVRSQCKECVKESNKGYSKKYWAKNGEGIKARIKENSKVHYKERYAKSIKRDLEYNKELVEYMRAIAVCNSESCTCDRCPFLTYKDKCDLVRFSEFSKIVEG